MTTSSDAAQIKFCMALNDKCLFSGVRLIALSERDIFRDLYTVGPEFKDFEQIEEVERGDVEL
jgi:hypothetical protein